MPKTIHCLEYTKAFVTRAFQTFMSLTSTTHLQQLI
jgi:hypothetical protein